MRFDQGEIMSVKATNTINCERSELRKFGLTIGIVLSLWGVLFLWRGKDGYAYLFIIAVVFLFLGCALPPLLKPIYKIWMTLTTFLGWFMTRFILSVLFFFVITPIGFLARLCGKDFLDKKFKKKANSYWISRKTKKCDKISYERQF